MDQIFVVSYFGTVFVNKIIVAALKLQHDWNLFIIFGGIGSYSKLLSMHQTIGLFIIKSINRIIKIKTSNQVFLVFKTFHKGI